MPELPIPIDEGPTCVYCGHSVDHHDPDVPECCIYWCTCRAALVDDGPFEKDGAEVDW